MTRDFRTPTVMNKVKTFQSGCISSYVCMSDWLACKVTPMAPPTKCSIQPFTYLFTGNYSESMHSQIQGSRGLHGNINSLVLPKKKDCYEGLEMAFFLMYLHYHWLQLRQVTINLAAILLHLAFLQCVSNLKKYSIFGLRG